MALPMQDWLANCRSTHNVRRIKVKAPKVKTPKVKTATSKNGITEVLATPIIYQTKLFKADGMNVLAPEPMEVGPHVNARTFSPEHKGGNPKKSRGGGAATSGLIFRGVR